MSLYGLLTTGASGMSAQSTLLSTVADNVANIDTTGYKDAETQFSSLVLNSGASNYQSGSVLTETTVSISAQGSITSTSSPTDLAIQGNGFFVVQGPNGTPVLTRAGSFTENASGNLVNAAGYTLLGYASGTSGVANGYTGLVPVNLSKAGLTATPTSSGQLYLNLPSNSTPVTVANDLPSSNLASATPTDKTSMVTYDDLGNQVTLDVYLTNTGQDTNGPGGATESNWEVDVYNAADATNGGFPYTSGPLVTQTLNFDPTTGNLNSASPTSLSVPIPNGGTMTLDMSQTTQLATGYTVLTASANGNASSAVSSFTVGADGTVSALYQNGKSTSLYSVPLANVISPDKMTVISGNAFEPGLNSGTVQIGTAGVAGYGSIESGALESSTVDLSNELTNMIAAQNNYQANSKVFQTGSQLLQVLIGLDR
ncbi:MAG: flagellar hook protein FlgE [Rhodomicrobium sp.]